MFLKANRLQQYFIPINVRSKLGLHGFGHLFLLSLKKLVGRLLETILPDTMHSDAQHTHIYGEFYWFDGTLTDPKLI